MHGVDEGFDLGWLVFLHLGFRLTDDLNELINDIGCVFVEISVFFLKVVEFGKKIVGAFGRGYGVTSFKLQIHFI